VHNREALLARIADNLTDLAIMVRPPADAGLRERAFAPHPYVIVAAPDHPLAARKRVADGDAAERELRRAREGLRHRKSMEEGFGEHMKDVRVAMQIPSTETIKQAVMAGMGISFLSAHTVSKELRREPQPDPRPGLPADAELVRRPSAATSACRRWRRRFRDFLLSDGAGLIAQIVPFDPGP
jgi:DNA-binding transcriptional LysR family regulator